MSYYIIFETLEEAYREAKSRRFENKECPKQEGIKVANNKQYLMVLGGPGAGKSTFLRKMGLEALKGKKGEFKHGCIPVFIELKLFNSGDINIERVITEEFQICGFPVPDKFTTKALEEGKLLILLDGLDEVPTNNLNQAITEIQNFVDRYDKNRFIASCRTAAYRSGFRRFNDVAMADFDDTQIQQFILNWFQSDSDKQAKTGEKCWELLKKPENQAAKELAHTPLLLTFLCLVYDRSQNFPDNRSVLYRKALRILLEEWASEKRILLDEIYQGLHTELEEILLSEIAYTGFEADRLFIPVPNTNAETVYFTEVQFQPDTTFYRRLFSEIFLYLRQNETVNLWRAVVVYPTRSIETADTIPYQSLLSTPQVQRIYLDEIGEAANNSFGLRIVQLIIEREETAVTSARELISHAREQITDATTKREILELIETILVYKFTRLSREEIRQMFNFTETEFKQTRIYQSIKEEGIEEGKQEGEIIAKFAAVPRLLALGLTVEQIAQALELTMEQVQQASENQTN